ncbi:transcription antitermination factor NusB [Clostridium sp. YIM B02515]|uniref:Transcription antitermination protein NusB n=1 Tax=Clostridium rhizosphaerae TaxID=2803861 RepID=A0ABS1TEW7_9CLOT|nr:transcription antitermination factor NusB [Clostridium rhizosphaerae]MBL4937908.1 transcription antitermination factor NusB [Clostridium rhizosphaerae]
MNRRKSREIAMKLLFEMSIKKENYNEIYENFKENTDMDLQDIDMEYVFRVLKGVEENQKTIDDKIEENLINWKLNRVAKIDLAILRTSTYEIFYEDDIPDKVSVNEGIELAKKYSDEKSFQFINGVLGKMIKNNN